MDMDDYQKKVSKTIDDSMYKNKPSIGRIIHVVIGSEGSELIVRPAIIVGIIKKSDEIFKNPENTFEEQFIDCSIFCGQDDRKYLQEFFDDGYAIYSEDSEIPSSVFAKIPYSRTLKVGCWSWPERV